MKKRYYSISFYSHREKDQNMNEATIVVDGFAEAFLCGAGLPLIHQYTWPDGSCYKIVCSVEEPQDLKRRLNALLSMNAQVVRCGIFVSDVSECPPEQKRGEKTLEAIFKHVRLEDLDGARR